MKKLILPLLTMLMFVAGLSLWAADIWVAKPYTEWNDKDITKIMSDSPWAKKVSVEFENMGRGGGAPAGGGGGGGGSKGGGKTPAPKATRATRELMAAGVVVLPRAAVAADAVRAAVEAAVAEHLRRAVALPRSNSLFAGNPLWLCNRRWLKISSPRMPLRIPTRRSGCNRTTCFT